MKKLLLLIVILFALTAVGTSFTHKDLNEYGKWLQFYDLQDEDFKQAGTDKQVNLNWEPYNLTKEYKKLYEALYFYSPDSTSFLDLYTYNIIPEKDAKGNLTWFGGDPEKKVQLVKTKKLSSSTLLFFGSSDFAETAMWRNQYLFEIFGFRENNGKYIPAIWKYDLEKNVSKEFECGKTFETRPKSYLAEVRLKSMKRKE